MAELIGDGELIKALLDLSDDVKENKKTHKAAAQVVLKPARAKPAKKSGALKKSGRKGAGKKEGTVTFGNKRVVYASAYHFGDPKRIQGGYMQPDPFLYETGTEETDKVADVYRDRLVQVSRRF